MGAATDGGKGSEERTRVNGEGPIDTASFRKQSTEASCQRKPTERRPDVLGDRGGAH